MIQIPDLMNGLLEFTGGWMLAFNVRKLWRDKMVRGVHWGPTLFFFAWGVWNLYYYPHLGQWFSFAGGCWIVAVNGAWWLLMLRYRSR
jgi:hypothetical protein